MNDVIGAVRATQAWLAAGTVPRRGEHATFLSALGLERVWDAHSVIMTSAEAERDVERVFADADTEYAARSFRRFVCDPTTSPVIEAELLLRGYELEAEIQHVLERPLPRSPARFDIHAEPDHHAVASMVREDYAEQCGEDFVSDGIHVDLCAFRARKGLQTYVARVEGEAAGHLSSWLGPAPYGKVEYLYVRPAFRGRGIARALIDHAVAQLQAQRSSILIGSRPHDWPRLYYERLGFRPIFVKRTYTLHL